MPKPWTFLTTHGLVLLAIARDPDIRLREIAEAVGVTPRAAQNTVNDLVDAGYLERHKEGRRSHYLFRRDRHLPHPTTAPYDAADLFGALVEPPRIHPSGEEVRALIIACSDSRYQEPLRELLAAEGLLASAESILWPGGSAALAGRYGTQIIAAASAALGNHRPERVILVAHQGCDIAGARTRTSSDPTVVGRAIASRRQLSAARIRKAFGVEPELWFMSERGVDHVRAPGRRSGAAHLTVASDEESA